MIDQKEGETNFAIKIHYDNMVSRRWYFLHSHFHIFNIRIGNSNSSRENTHSCTCTYLHSKNYVSLYIRTNLSSSFALLITHVFFVIFSVRGRTCVHTQRRVTIRRHNYFYKPIEGTPFSLGLALPEGYGMFELLAEQEIKHAIINGK